MASQTIYIEIPGSDIKLYPGYKIKLNRFDSDIWTVHYGWYDFSGNRPIMGWYLTNDSDCNSVKPIQKIDTYDIYLVDTSNKEDVDVETIQSNYTENNNLEGSYIKNRPFYADKFDSLDSRYNDCDTNTIANTQGTFIQFTFNDIHFDLDVDTEYTINWETNLNSDTIQVQFKAFSGGIYYVSDHNRIEQIIYGGKIGTNLVSGEINSVIPRQNQISFIVNADENLEWFNVSIDGVQFDYVKQAEQKYLQDEWHYITYRYPYFHIGADADGSSGNRATLNVGVPVFSYDEPTRTYTNFAKNGIRYGNFFITGQGGLQVDVDLFPKDQEWELWTLNQQDDDSDLRLGIGTIIDTLLTNNDFYDNILFAMPYHKAYILGMPNIPYDNVVWAGIQMVIYFDTDEHCNAFADYVNSLQYNENASITVRIKDINYVEEIAEILIPEQEGD